MKLAKSGNDMEQIEDALLRVPSMPLRIGNPRIVQVYSCKLVEIVDLGPLRYYGTLVFIPGVRPKELA